MMKRKLDLNLKFAFIFSLILLGQIFCESVSGQALTSSATLSPSVKVVCDMMTSEARKLEKDPSLLSNVEKLDADILNSEDVDENTPLTYEDKAALKSAFRDMILAGVKAAFLSQGVEFEKMEEPMKSNVMNQLDEVFNQLGGEIDKCSTLADFAKIGESNFGFK